MPIFSRLPTGTRAIKLEGKELMHAKNFTAIAAECNEEVAALQEEYAAKSAEAHQRGTALLRREWHFIATAFGIDPEASWGDPAFLLDCDYINQGLAFLQETIPAGAPTEQRAPAETAPPGTLLN